MREVPTAEEMRAEAYQAKQQFAALDDRWSEEMGRFEGLLQRAKALLTARDQLLGIGRTK